jgi:DNA-binding transcriptional LysR family regulator
MDLRAMPYRYFITVADLGSFTRAATTLNVSQPALSAQIRELERQLGFALFKRTSRSVRLTREGNAFLGNARRIVLETEFINQKAREIRTNQLRIGVAHYTNLIPERLLLTDGFLRNHNRIQVSFVPQSHGRLYEALARSDIDIAITLEPSPDNERSAVEAGIVDEFERCVVAQRELGLLIPIEHPLAEHGSTPIERLSGLTIGIFDRIYGVQLVETISRHLRYAEAELVRPPEADSLGLRRYATMFRSVVVELGWFEAPLPPDFSSLVLRNVAGLNITTNLVVLRSHRPQSEAAGLFWAHAGIAVAKLDNARIGHRPGQS